MTAPARAPHAAVTLSGYGRERHGPPPDAPWIRPSTPAHVERYGDDDPGAGTVPDFDHVGVAADDAQVGGAARPGPVRRERLLGTGLLLRVPSGLLDGVQQVTPVREVLGVQPEADGSVDEVARDDGLRVVVPHAQAFEGGLGRTQADADALAGVGQPDQLDRLGPRVRVYGPEPTAGGGGGRHRCGRPDRPGSSRNSPRGVAGHDTGPEMTQAGHDEGKEGHPLLATLKV